MLPVLLSPPAPPPRQVSWGRVGQHWRWWGPWYSPGEARESRGWKINVPGPSARWSPSACRWNSGYRALLIFQLFFSRPRTSSQKNSSCKSPERSPWRSSTSTLLFLFLSKPSPMTWNRSRLNTHRPRNSHPWGQLFYCPTPHPARHLVCIIKGIVACCVLYCTFPATEEPGLNGPVYLHFHHIHLAGLLPWKPVNKSSWQRTHDTSSNAFADQEICPDALSIWRLARSIHVTTGASKGLPPG